MASQHSDKRSKSHSSEQDTRNPTTNKKVIYYTPVQKHSQNIPNHQRYSLNRPAKQNTLLINHEKLKKKCKQLSHSMYQLHERKNQCLRSSRYNQAKQINQSLTVIQRKRAKTQVKRLRTEHKLQKKRIKNAHKKEMAKFEQVWQNYFIGLKAKEQLTLIKFKDSQEKDIRFVQQQLVQRCKYLKGSTGELKSLQKKQRILQKEQRYDYLSQLKQYKKSLKQRLLSIQQQRIYNWAKREQQILKSYHTKKYNALMNRIEELHNDKYRVYKREGERLRLKYGNVVRKLEHEQRMEMNEVAGRVGWGRGVEV